jgi:hypothetical protein
MGVGTGTDCGHRGQKDDPLTPAARRLRGPLWWNEMFGRDARGPPQARRAGRRGLPAGCSSRGATGLHAHDRALDLPAPAVAVGRGGGRAGSGSSGVRDLALVVPGSGETAITLPPRRRAAEAALLVIYPTRLVNDYGSDGAQRRRQDVYSVLLDVQYHVDVRERVQPHRPVPVRADVPRARSRRRG